MIKEEFLHRFTLAPRIQPVQEFSFTGETRPASVLITLHETAQGLEVVLTKRAAHLRHHAGQISFPGGKVEPTDLSHQHTALRETFEEIGLSVGADDIVGELPTFTTISGFSVTPIVAITQLTGPFVIDKGEVAEVFSIPLGHLLAPHNHLFHTVTRHNTTYEVYFIPWQNTYVWGATAGMLINLAKLLGLRD